MDSITQRFQSAAHADLSTTLLTAAVVGLVSHVPIHSFEFERIAFQFMGGCVACFFGLGGLYVYTGQCGSLSVALARSLLVQAVFHTSLLASIAVYRLGFHRCRHIPGPVGAKVSRFYAMYLTSKKVQFQNEVLQMHEKYGDFVRTGPREVSIFRKAAVNAIFGPHSKCSKSTWYAQNGYDPNETTLQMCRDRTLYRRRRRAWDRGLSIKALATYVPRVKSHADLLIQRLRERAGRPVDVTQWGMFFAFDMIGDVGYGKSFDQLVTLQEHPAVQPIHKHMILFAILQNTPWFLRLLDCIPGTAAAFAVTAKFFEDQRRAKQKMFSSDENPRDIVSWLLKAMAEKDGTGPPSTMALDQDTKLLLIAGSDTSAAALTNALFFLARYPEKQEKLRTELLRECSGGTTSAAGWSYDAVLGVKYLDYFIHETLRLKPSVDEVHIPGGVVVTVPTVWLQRDPRYWQRADEFLPERWGDDRRAEMGTDGSPYFPFSLGAFSCPGKNLALMVLRIALSSIVRNFEVEFAPGETGVEFDNEVKDTFTTMLPPLNLQFTQIGAELLYPCFGLV
ncbi:cytochrome P450 67 [Apiospora marii]|uniref:cytochrome P450 67 n=1 Tax=Apiospora marii TaxID=335849 RepID=UPI003130FB5A